MKGVEWQVRFFVEFESIVYLTKRERFILLGRIEGMTVSEMSAALNVSESTVKKDIAKIKKKYDIAQQQSDILPKRRKSAEEDYMDTH